MQLPLPATLAIETALNRVLALDDAARARLPALQGKVIDLHLQGLDLHLYLLIHSEKIEAMGFFDGEIDATISGTPLSMASMMQSKNALFQGDVTISGDMDVGKRFNRLLNSIDIDWEEQLSRLTGDIAAHQIGNTVRGVQQWLERAVQSFNADMGDYLREEALLTPTAGECEHFYQDVDTLRSDVDRLDARLQQLTRKRDTVS